ncbi:acyl-CoA dehydrogenase [Hwanghaeella grinnelliae]|uniref:Acyl-CoA dehydrogenase n=1 Tax=Hwanghaeella grinnelliae TaxID=2500179 RepID=A0A437QH57_9PROT|nr:MaoC family dehydratase N-terminal domain-containing protein [Hwanghaeella grinnelliae]RVU33907.1 acyl-CoA dehydrogenase [Hwanghaeella grinnelliae]
MADAQNPTPGSDFSEAVGRTEESFDCIALDRACAMAATLGLGQPPSAGDPLPPGWHWLFFNRFAPRGELGADGHPKRGGFIPDVGLPRRMWAGGRLQYLAPLAIGADVARHSEILSIQAKEGRAGRLVFVTIRHRISSGGTLCIEEEQDIVYREADTGQGPKPTPAAAPEGAAWSEEVTADPVLLFRYSALTSNGHRIHYDQPYARAEEGYRDLVVHGPLISTLLQNFAASLKPGAALARFDYRGMAPLFVDRPFRIEAAEGEGPDELVLWAKGPDGEHAMKAFAVFS